MDNLTNRRHAALVDRMATALGRDLQEDVIAARLDLDTLHDMVVRCTGCTDPEGCEHFLDTAERDRAEQGPRANGPADAPDYCRNAQTFRLLKDGHRA